MKLILLLVVILLSSAVGAQELKGRIRDSTGSPVSYAGINLKKGSSRSEEHTSELQSP